MTAKSGKRHGYSVDPALEYTGVGSESPCRAELPSTDLHSLFFSNSSLVMIFHEYFYLILSQ